MLLNPIPLGMIYIITPCIRPENLGKIAPTIPPDCQWVIAYDSAVKKPVDHPSAVVITTPHTGNFGSEVINCALDRLALKDDDWFYALDDDNIIHPHWRAGIEPYLRDNQLITWAQDLPDGRRRLDAIRVPEVGQIDTASYMVRGDIAKTLRFRCEDCADGRYAERAYAMATNSERIDLVLCYYNYLERLPLPRRIEMILRRIFRAG